MLLYSHSCNIRHWNAAKLVCPHIFTVRSDFHIKILLWSQTLHDCENILSQHDEASRKDSIPSGTALCIDKFNDEFLTSMSDDFHTPVTLAAMSEPLKTINDLLHTRKVFWFQLND